MSHPIRVGIGGWSYEPWRETFYPKDVTAKKELAYASSKVTAIEINSTFYRNQSPAVFKRWASETPDDFVFTAKAPRFTTAKKTPDEIKEAIRWFVDGGVREMGKKLGAINWQFQAGRKFDSDYFKTFLGALPQERDGEKLRHAIEVRHASFNDEVFYDLLRANNCALISADDPDWPMEDVATADFAYTRLQQSDPECVTGYALKDLDAWAKTLKSWAKTRDVFAFFIAGAKERNPAAAQAMIKRLS